MFKIVFMGTPEFALPVFEYLIRNHSVVLAVTKEDKPKGRGGHMAMPPVKEMALKYGIPVVQPAKAKDESFLEALKNAGADLFVTCAYGKILPQSVLDLPPLGCINVHASILPEYRGAAPIWHSVIDGKPETGITTMLTDIGMDTGDILMTDRIPIGPDETMGELHDRLSLLGPVTLDKTLRALADGTLERKKQDDSLATYASMVDRETGRIDWNADCRTVHNLVRGTNPFPTAYSVTEEGARVKIWLTKTVPETESVPEGALPGDAFVSGDGKNRAIRVVCGSGMIDIIEIQGENARRMTSGEYLNGHTVSKFK